MHTCTHTCAFYRGEQGDEVSIGKFETLAQEWDKVCCSVLQFVAMCKSVLQCVVVCCSLSKCVAVCCSLFIRRCT